MPNYWAKSKHFFYSTLLEKSDREPVSELNDRHKADSKAKSTNASHVGNEVQPSHLP